MKNPFLSRVLFFLGLAAALSFGACSDDDGTTPTDPTPPPTTDKSLSVDKTEVSFDADGTQTQTFEITSEGVTWVVTPLDSWVTATPSSGRGNATITVTAEKNTTGAERMSGVDIAATDVDPVTVTVKQAAGEKVDPDPSATPMTLAEGVYMGNISDNVAIMQLTFSDMSVDSEGYLIPPGKVIYLTIAVEGTLEEGVVLAGDYYGKYDEISLDNPQVGDVVIALQQGNQVEPLCFYTELEAGVEEPTVDENVLEADLKIRNLSENKLSVTFSGKSRSGISFAGTYEGEIPLYVQEEESLSTLTGDQTPELIGADGAYMEYGGGLSMGFIQFVGDMQTEPFDILSVYMLLRNEDAAKGPEGSYTVSMDEKAGAIIPGTIYQGSTMASWFVKGRTSDDEGSIMFEEGGPVMSGTMTIVKNDSGYTATYTFYDDAAEPHKISGTYTGPISWSDVNGATASLKTRAAGSMPLRFAQMKRIGARQPTVAPRGFGHTRLSSFL